MARRTSAYSEGDVFRVRSSKIVGVVARTGSGVACCYFFVAEGEVDLMFLCPRDAAYILRVHDSELVSGDWNTFACVAPWDRTRWPMPAFSVSMIGLPVASLTYYSEEDAAVVVRSEPVQPDQIQGLPIDQSFSTPQLLRVMDPESYDRIYADFYIEPLSTDDTGRAVVAYFRFPSVSQRKRFAKAVQELGWRTEVEHDDDRLALVATRQQEGLNSLELQTLQASLDESAELHGGSMTAWELEV